MKNKTIHPGDGCRVTSAVRQPGRLALLVTRHVSLAAILLGLLTCRAQTSTNQPPTSAGFFSSLGSYFSSFNTNLDATFGRNPGKFWTGVDSLEGTGNAGGQNVPLANVIGLSYDVYQPTNSSVSLSLESETLNSGVAGTVVSQEIGPGLNFIIHDTELTAFAHGGYDFTAASTKGESAGFGAVGLRLAKALTEHTYAGTELSVVLPRNEQRIGVFAGFTF